MACVLWALGALGLQGIAAAFSAAHRGDEDGASDIIAVVGRRSRLKSDPMDMQHQAAPAPPRTLFVARAPTQCFARAPMQCVARAPT